MPLFSNFLRPNGVSEIVFTDQPTQIRFRWNSKDAVIYLNQNEWYKLSPALRYFVLMHEVGHLKTMPILRTQITAQHETEADHYAFNECLKVGIVFESVATARQLYFQAINQ